MAIRQMQLSPGKADSKSYRDDGDGAGRNGAVSFYGRLNYKMVKQTQHTGGGGGRQLAEKN